MDTLMYVVLILGIFEIISNGFHLSKIKIESIGKSARVQHQELSEKLTDIHFFYKVIEMFIFGLIFTVVGILIYFRSSFYLEAALYSTLCFGIYGVVQAIAYRSNIKVWISMLVYNIPFILYLFS